MDKAREPVATPAICNRSRPEKEGESTKPQHVRALMHRRNEGSRDCRILGIRSQLLKLALACKLDEARGPVKVGIS